MFNDFWFSFSLMSNVSPKICYVVTIWFFPLIEERRISRHVSKKNTIVNKNLIFKNGFSFFMSYKFKLKPT